MKISSQAINLDPERVSVRWKARLKVDQIQMDINNQVTFMERLVQPDQLRTRIQMWVEEEIRLDRLPPKSGAILEAVLFRGELPRGEAADIVGTGDRQARRVVSALLDRGVLTSASTRAPLRLAFPAALASRWMPGLFPEQV